jgi:type I restriction enzyme M protein
MVECVRPEPMKTIADPACGTGGFFPGRLRLHPVATPHKLDKEQKQVPEVQDLSRLGDRGQHRAPCLMNLFLHNIGDMDQRQPHFPGTTALIADAGAGSTTSHQSALRQKKQP